MAEFQRGVIVAFLQVVETAPKGRISYDEVPGNLDPRTFDALSMYCAKEGYISRTGGTLDARVIFATLTEKGQGLINSFLRDHRG